VGVVGLVLNPEVPLPDDFSYFHVLSKTVKYCPQSWEACQSQDLCIRKSEIHEDGSRMVKCFKAANRYVRPTVSNRSDCVTENEQLDRNSETSERKTPVCGWASVAVIRVSL
jgi:hypothetical protein